MSIWSVSHRDITFYVDIRLNHLPRTKFSCFWTNLKRDFQIFKITSLSSGSCFSEKKVQKLPKRDKHKLPGTTAGVGGPADSHFMHTTQAAINSHRRDSSAGKDDPKPPLTLVRCHQLYNRCSESQTNHSEWKCMSQRCHR